MPVTTVIGCSEIPWVHVALFPTIWNSGITPNDQFRKGIKATYIKAHARPLSI